MMNRIVGIGSLFVIAFILMFVIVFKDMFVWMWNNPDKLWCDSARYRVTANARSHIASRLLEPEQQADLVPT